MNFSWARWCLQSHLLWVEFRWFSRNCTKIKLSLASSTVLGVTYFIWHVEAYEASKSVKSRLSTLALGWWLRKYRSMITRERFSIRVFIFLSVLVSFKRNLAAELPVKELCYRIKWVFLVSYSFTGTLVWQRPKWKYSHQHPLATNLRGLFFC